MLSSKRNVAMMNVMVMVLAIVVGVGIYLAGYHTGANNTDAKWQADWNAQVHELTQAKLDAELKARSIELQHQLTIDKVRYEHKQQMAIALADAVAADDMHKRVHDKARGLAESAGSCPSDPSASIRSQAARATNAIVLADLFQRADRVAGQLAAAHDQARAAGLACEQMYESVRVAQRAR